MAEIFCDVTVPEAPTRRQVGQQPELLQLAQQPDGVVAGDRGVEDLRARRANLAEILRVVLGIERGKHLADRAGAHFLRARLEGGDGRAPHLIVRPEVEHLGLRLLLGQPDGERGRLLAGARIHAKDVGRAAVAGDRVGERHRGRDQLAGAFGELPNRKRRAGADGAGEEVDLGDLEQLLRLLHRDRGVGFFVLVEQLDRTSHDAAGGIHLLHGEIEAPPHLLADSGIGAAERRHHADLDRVGGTDAGYRGRREQRGKRRCLECFHHVLPGFVWA